jgi:hypothetical protein
MPRIRTPATGAPLVATRARPLIRRVTGAKVGVMVADAVTLGDG